MRMLARVRADIGRNLSGRRLAFAYLTEPAVSATVLLRCAETLLARGHRRTSRLVRARLATKHGVHVAEGAEMGAVRLHHPTAIIVGHRARVGDNVTIYQGVTIGAGDPRSGDGMPILEDGVTVFANAVVAGPITVGHDATVAAGAVVMTDVPPGATVVGFGKIVEGARC